MTEFPLCMEKKTVILATSFLLGLWYFTSTVTAPLTVGQRNYFTTSVTLLYQLPLLAVLFITGNNNVIFKNKLGPLLYETVAKYGKIC